jgi:hypothetical protein
MSGPLDGGRHPNQHIGEYPYETMCSALMYVPNFGRERVL